MAGGTLYIEPILEELQEKIGELETGMEEIKTAMAEIPAKLDDQIEQLRKVVSSAGAGASKAYIEVGTSLYDLLDLGTATKEVSSSSTFDLCSFYCAGDGYANVHFPSMTADENNTGQLQYIKFFVWEDGTKIYTSEEKFANAGQTVSWNDTTVKFKYNSEYKIQFYIGTNMLRRYAFGNSSQENHILRIKYDIHNVIADSPFIHK